MLNKYRANPFYLDLQTNEKISTSSARQLSKVAKERFTYFASKQEYRVYKELLNLSSDYELQLQPKIQLIPPDTLATYPNGKYWKADFAIRKQKKIVAVVEAKGEITPDFPFVLALLETNNKEVFNKLWLVFHSRIPQKRIVNNLIKSAMRDRIIKLNQVKLMVRAMNMQ